MQINQFIFKLSMVVVSLALGAIYLINLFAKNSVLFVWVAVVLLVFLAVVSGLSIALTHLFEDPTDKRAATHFSEKWFFATVCLALSAIAGMAERYDKLIDDPHWTLMVGRLLLLTFSTCLFCQSILVFFQANQRMADLLFRRWGSHPKTPAPQDHLQQPGISIRSVLSTPIPATPLQNDSP
jgi:hypothetical protein